MSEEIEYPSKERERAKVNVKVSAEVNTYLHDLYNQIQYEFCEQYEDEIKDLQQKVEQLEKENKILKDTILKALEFINNHTYRWKDTQFGEMVEVEDFEPGLKPIELINILQNIFENK